MIVAQGEDTVRIVLRDLFDLESHALREGWQPFRQGIDILPLYRNEQNGASAALLCYAAGASVPTHEHPDYEHILVLSGSQSDEDGSYGPGSCVIHGPGTRHSVRSEQGCVVLAIWAKPVVFVAEG